MKNKNGFTLVELLAVLVILAIVLIIAVPGVLSIINSTKENAYKSQLKMIKEAARTYITTESDKVSWNDGTTVVTLDMLQTSGYLDKKIIDPRNKKEIVCVTVLLTKNENNKISYDVDDSCNNVYLINPRVGSGMIPLVYDGINWVKADVTNKNNSWFNYETQQWANVATVAEDVRSSLASAETGTVIPMDKINAMFTWIPRFKYKLFNVDGTVSPVGNKNLAGDMMIDVKFETKATTKSSGIKNGEWLTHPAFTFGGKDLDGFWIGKFETGSVTGPGSEEENNVVDSSKILIKPNVSSWNNIQLVNAYKSVQKMSEPGNSFGLTYNEDSHLTKNIEWGTMAYLTYSKYGKAGNSTYTGLEKEVGPNSNTDLKTGCGNSPLVVGSSNVCNTYSTKLGQAASTTGNITGIYDTSGGSWDYVAGVIKDMDGQNIIVGNSGFTQEELNQLARLEKYLDVYEHSLDGSVWSGHLGDATIELGPFSGIQTSWYMDSAKYPREEGNPSYSWFVRGGEFSNQSKEKGTMSFSRGSGATGSSRGFRVTIV